MARQIVIVVGLILFGFSSGFCIDSSGLIQSNDFFFAPQSPFQFSQVDDNEWGTSSATRPISESPQGYKSPSQAVLYSLLLPGLGEIYVGDSRTKAVSFLIADAGIWSTFLLYRHLGKWRKDDYMNYAMAYAGVNSTGKDDIFWDMIGFYQNRDEYNKVSRVYTPTNPFYPETPEWDWQWENKEQLSKYRNIKNDSKSYYRNANFALGAAALNRAISAVFAWRSAKGHNRSLRDEFSRFNFEVCPDFCSNSIEFRIAYTRSF